VSVEDPEGTVTKHTFGTLFHQNEGTVLQTDIVDKQGNLARTTRISYVEPIAPLGWSDQGRGDGVQSARMLETSRRAIEQQGVTFAWDATVFDGYARPTFVTRSSSLGYKRSDTTTYSDNTGKWVLGQIGKVVESTTGLVPILNQYNAVTANLESVTKFGKLQQTLTYNADGTLATKKDAAGNTTTYTNYKRGIAQNVRYADGSSESAAVDNIGLIRTVTDALGYTTTYDYDAIGRLKTITYPGNDTVAWNPTKISYTQSWVPEYGLTPGHWREDTVTGNAAETTYYDALWRPVYSERWDQADRNGTVRGVRKLFDSAGRKTFESYPSRGYDPASDGVYQEYDALGRPTITKAISELGTLYTGIGYVDGFTKVVTDARSHSS
jgi:YD repeat-containing protein